MRTQLAVALQILFFNLSASAATIQALNDLHDASLPLRSVGGISSDGATIVGTGRNVDKTAVIWKRSEGLRRLSDIPDHGLNKSSNAREVSEDGSVVFGYLTSAPGDSTPYVWDAVTGFNLLEDDRGAAGEVRANGMSSDGSVIVGSVDGKPATWTASSGWTVHDGFAMSSGRGRMSDVSTVDGVVVGSAVNRNGKTEAFIWQEDDGMVALGFLPEATEATSARKVSADGTTVVGIATDDSFNSLPWVWNAHDGMRPLDHTQGSLHAEVYDLSADGSVMVGISSHVNAPQAAIWDEMNGFRLLEDVLSEAGVDLTGWELESAIGVSADGRVITGNGSFNGIDEPWIATLNAIPEPSALFLGALAIVATSMIRPRRVI